MNYSYYMHRERNKWAKKNWIIHVQLQLSVNGNGREKGKIPSIA